VIFVENWISLIVASACGVTSPLNKASSAKGTRGRGVGEEVGEDSGVAVSIKLVGLFSGVFKATGV